MNDTADPDTVNPFEAFRAGVEYQDVRPGYPAEAVREVLATASGTAIGSGSDRPTRRTRVADIGAGTGKFSRAMLRINPDLEVFAVEPSAQMRDSFADEPRGVGAVTLVDGTSEATGLPDRSVDLVVWAQSFHWVDPTLSGTEARRILRDGGAAAVIVNQLDVAIPWVHRLTRIMRSGDVHRADAAPFLKGFASDPVQTFLWEQEMSPSQVMALARTRSSYLRSSDTVRAKMQQNLEWYLHEHLGYSHDDTVCLPYTTLVWGMH